jgi:hypothetical protein
VGLLEHPTIWAFLGLQVVLPLSIRRSLGSVLRARAQMRRTLTASVTLPDSMPGALLRFVRLEDPRSRFVAALLYSFGFAAFVWNTYQNQLPGIMLPFDFWDSTNHVCGFWLTRAYKLYLFVWLLPYVAFLHVGVLFAVLHVIRRQRVAGHMALLPFHPDGVGGLGFVPGLVSTPIGVTLLAASVPTAAAFAVHRAFDPTPLIGVAAVVSGVTVAYIIPIAFLRSDIVGLKRALIDRLWRLQQMCSPPLDVGGTVDPQLLRAGSEALDYFEKVRRRVLSIPNYPHLKRLFGYVGLFLTPSAISLGQKLYSEFLPVVLSHARKP